MILRNINVFLREIWCLKQKLTFCRYYTNPCNLYNSFHPCFFTCFTNNFCSLSKSLIIVIHWTVYSDYNCDATFKSFFNSSQVICITLEKFTESRIDTQFPWVPHESIYCILSYNYEFHSRTF